MPPPLHLHVRRETFQTARPQWLWAPAARAWRYELDAGHGCVAAGLAAVATFRFAHGISRRHNKSAFSVEQ